MYIWPSGDGRSILATPKAGGKYESASSSTVVTTATELIAADNWMGIGGAESWGSRFVLNESASGRCVFDTTGLAAKQHLSNIPSFNATINARDIWTLSLPDTRHRTPGVGIHGLGQFPSEQVGSYAAKGLPSGAMSRSALEQYNTEGSAASMSLAFASGALPSTSARR
jgi:hypothetical protein